MAHQKDDHDLEPPRRPRHPAGSPVIAPVLGIVRSGALAQTDAPSEVAIRDTNGAIIQIVEFM